MNAMLQGKSKKSISIELYYLYWHHGPLLPLNLEVTCNWVTMGGKKVSIYLSWKGGLEISDITLSSLASYWGNYGTTSSMVVHSSTYVISKHTTTVLYIQHSPINKVVWWKESYSKVIQWMYLARSNKMLFQMNVSDLNWIWDLLMWRFVMFAWLPHCYRIW